MGTPDFLNLLHDSKPAAVYYGVEWCDELGVKLPSIGLAVRDANAVKQAFDEFERWGARQDGDVVDLALAFPSTTEYVLAVGPEAGRLHNRLTGYDRTLTPLYMSPVWMFPVRAVGTQVQHFSELRRGAIRPFLLSAAVMMAGGKGLAESIPGLKPILKFNCEVLRPGEESHGIAQLALQSREKTRGRSSPGSTEMHRGPDNSPEEVGRRRSRLLKAHFPVTTGRFLAYGLQPDTEKQLEALGLEEWQVHQAVCNLALAGLLDRDGPKQWRKSRGKEWISIASKAINAQFEDLDGDHLGLRALLAEDVAAQATEDARYLLSCLGVRSESLTLGEIQAAVGGKGYGNVRP